jgi:hypothetical protein
MSDFKKIEVLIMQKIPLRLQRSNWNELNKFILNEVKQYETSPSVDDLFIDFVQSALMQILVKTSKHLMKLSNKGKVMNSYSTISMSPVEKNCLNFVIRYYYSDLINKGPQKENDIPHFYSYLQPILDSFQQFDINNQSLTTTK